MKIHTLDDWQELADQIIPKLKHNILLLKGNLGAGKTTFSQALVSKLGSTDVVTSPTYTLVNEYHSPKGIIYHFDLYRMKSSEEALDIGIDEYLESSFLNIIEWPEIYMGELDGLSYHEMSIENKGSYREVYFR